MTPHRRVHQCRVERLSTSNSNVSNSIRTSSARFIGGHQLPASIFAPPGYSPNLPLPSTATEANAFEEVGRRIAESSPSVVGQRKFLGDFIEAHCKLQAGQYPPSSRKRHYQSCPEAGDMGHHEYRKAKFIVRISEQRVTPIGYHQKLCFDKFTRKWVHNVQLTPPLTTHQLRSDALLWAALRHRIALRPPSLCTQQAAIEESAMGLVEELEIPHDETPEPASMSSASSTVLVHATPSPLFHRSPAQNAPYTPTQCSSCGSRVGSLRGPRMDASPPTPPTDSRFETDEEEEAADTLILNWEPHPIAKFGKEKRTNGSVVARKVQRPPPRVTVSFYLMDQEVVNVQLPLTKRGICLGSHTSVLREQGVDRAQMIWILAPSQRDTDPIWKPCRWNRCIPIERVEPLVFKIHPRITTPFDKE